MIAALATRLGDALLAAAAEMARPDADRAIVRSDIGDAARIASSLADAADGRALPLWPVWRTRHIEPRALVAALMLTAVAPADGDAALLAMAGEAWHMWANEVRRAA